MKLILESATLNPFHGTREYTQRLWTLKQERLGSLETAQPGKWRDQLNSKELNHESGQELSWLNDLLILRASNYLHVIYDVNDAIRLSKLSVT